jgi:ABC-2 type transport system permease protein
MRNAALIARRELRARSRRTGYRVTTVLGVLVIASLFLVPTISDAIENSSRVTVAVVDPGGQTVKAMQAALPDKAPDGKLALELRATPDLAAAEALREDGTAKGTLTLDGGATYRADDPGTTVDDLRRALASATVQERLRERGLDAAAVSQVFATPPLRTVDTDGKTVSSDSRALVYALLLMLYMSILVYGAAASSAIVQEKASRITEVMIARVTPLEHMAGKLGGIGLAGLIQYAIWIVIGVAVLLVGDALGSSSGIDLADVPVTTLLAFGLFFLLGFALYGALYAGLSAPVSRIEDATAAGMLPGILIVASFLAASVALGDPDSSLARILSFIPPLSPMTMFTRVALGSPPLWEVLVSVALLLVTIAAVLWAAAKVYRAGILLYGTRPTLTGVLRMVRSA